MITDDTPCPRCGRAWWDQGYCDHYFHIEGRNRQRENK